MKELIKKLFTRKKPSQTQEMPMLKQSDVSSNNPIEQPQMVVDSWEKETKYKSLNAATILVNIMLEQNNVSSNTESNNNNK